MTAPVPDLDWSPDAIFTEAHAWEIMQRGACLSTRRYIWQTVGSWVRQRPLAALRYAADLLTPEQLDACAKQWPRTAMRCATYLLTPERRAWCEARL